MESAQATAIKMEMPDEEASLTEAELKRELMELDPDNQSSGSVHDVKGLSEVKVESESPEKKILESKDESGADASDNLLIESKSMDHQILFKIKEDPDTSGFKLISNESTETLSALKVLSEELKQENSCTKRKELSTEDDFSMSEVKYVNMKDFLEIGETVVTSSGDTLANQQNSAAKQMKPNPVKPCSEITDVVPCEGLKCIQKLLEGGNLRKLSPSEKAGLITGPRPTPDLEIKTSKKQQRKFKRSIYQTSWVAGCSHMNKFFCWCCILFSDNNSLWSKKGCNDLSNMSTAIKKHQISQKHLSAVISFHNFGKQRSLQSISRQMSDEINRYNTRVDYNRSVFKRLIDVVCHLAKLGLPFRSQDESETSLNKGNFLELVILLSKYDHVLANQMQENGTSYLTHQMQDDIIRSVSDVAKAWIEAEIKQSPYIFVGIDETPVANSRDQLFMVFRYFYENNIRERFMGFIDCPNCTVHELSEVVLGIIKKYDCEKKVIAQSYDGTSITAAVRNGIQLKVKEVSPQATYIWCDPHTFNMVLSKSCDRIGDLSSFFFSLFALVNFFSNNEELLLHYDMFCSKRLPDISPENRWSFVSCIVSTVYEQKQDLRNLLIKITDTPEKWDGETICSAENLLYMVTSFKFHFYLEVFLAIFEKTEWLNFVKQKSEVDVLYLIPKIDELKMWLNTFKSHFCILYENALKDNSPPPSSRMFPCARTRYNQIFVQIIENVSAEISDRYQDISNLRFLQLLNENHFDRHAAAFPKDEFDTLKKVFGDHFDTEALKNQLMCIFTAQEVKGFNLSQLIDFIDTSSFKDVFSELSKLTHLVAAVPTTCLAESEFSNLNKRVYAYLSNAQGQDSLIDLATIMIEKELLLNLRCFTSFYDDVMKSFSSKNRSFELEYK